MSLSFLQLPPEIHAEIFSFLKTSQRLDITLLCKYFQGLLLYSKGSAVFWKTLNASIIKRVQKYAFSYISPEVLIDSHGLFKSALSRFQNLRELEISYTLRGGTIFPELRKLIITTPRAVSLTPQCFPKLEHLAVRGANVKLPELSRLPLKTLRLHCRIDIHQVATRFEELRYLEIVNFQKFLQHLEAPKLLGISLTSMDSMNDVAAKKFNELEFIQVVDPLEIVDTHEATEAAAAWRETYKKRYDPHGVLELFRKL